MPTPPDAKTGEPCRAAGPSASQARRAPFEKKAAKACRERPNRSNLAAEGDGAPRIRPLG